MELKDMWLQLVALSRAINDKCEDGHLNARGAAFYAIHSTFEKIQEGISDDDTPLVDMPDLIMEVFYGGRGNPFPTSNEIVDLEKRMLGVPSSDSMELGRQVRDLLIRALELLNDIDSDNDTSTGENDLAANLARQLQHRLYFINNFLG